MNSSARRVAILSPHEVVVRGLRSMLAEAGHEVVEVTEVPEMVLYDVVGLHETGGEDLARLLRDAEATGATVIAVGRGLRPDLLARALAEGAHGSVPLEATGPELARAVDTADRSRAAGARSNLHEVRGGWHGPDLEVHLTERERDVLGLIARGYSNQEVAARSFLSINSVKTYIRTAYRKIGARSRSQAVIWCLTHGFPAELPEDAVAEAAAPEAVIPLARFSPARSVAG